MRTRALEEIKKVKWDPAWGEERISNMVAGRPDWCISRQRVWGVPIAMFQCEGCREFVGDPAVHRLVVDLFAREGADAWYKYSAEQILPSGTKCAKCGSTEVPQGDGHRRRVVRVGIEPRRRARPRARTSLARRSLPRGRRPASRMVPVFPALRGRDQGRGAVSQVRNRRLDARSAGPRQSKSLGNIVDPVDIADKLGAEIVRLWVASVDFREDVMASDELMQRVAESYRKIRNTFRYILGNVHDFDPARDVVPFAEMHPLDQYILLRAAEVTSDVREHYDSFTFHRLYQRLKDFCIVDLSAIYFDVLKDRLYTSAPKSKARRSAQTAIVATGRGASSPARARDELHRRRDLAVSAGDARPRRKRSSRTLPCSAATLTGTLPPDFDAAQ